MVSNFDATTTIIKLGARAGEGQGPWWFNPISSHMCACRMCWWESIGDQMMRRSAFIQHIYIYIYGPHLISWADILHFWHFLPSFIVKNAPILQPTNCGCKFVFLFSGSSLLLPFSAVFFLFSSASINLKA